jgi:D-alanyl-D-alanine carboxypeptidase (penicillin-binding protein 5/6)
MARPHPGHLFFMIVYLIVGAGGLIKLGLLLWNSVFVAWVYPYRPPLVSPLPKEARAAAARDPARLPAENLWLPSGEVKQSTLPAPPVLAKAYLSLDLETGRIIAARNRHLRLPIASLVKVMTALVAEERFSPEGKIVVPARAAAVGEDSMGLEAGEKLSLKELLYGLILASGNDAAETIAEGVAGRRELFVSWMNTKAHELGLTDTFFVNPSGLMEKDGAAETYRAEEYSTAYDLAVISRAFLNDPLLREIAATPEVRLPENGDHKSHELYSETNFLTTDERVRGLKMGYTPAAGLCGITYAEENGRRVLIVLLDSPNRREDLKMLLDYSFAVLAFSG